MTPDLPHAARRLLASADWKTLEPDLERYAGLTPAEGGPVRACGRYDMLAYLRYIARQGPAEAPKRTRAKA